MSLANPPEEFPSVLAGQIRASRRDFSQLFDSEAARAKPNKPVQLHVLVQASMLGAASSVEAKADVFAFRVAFRHAHDNGWLKQLIVSVVTAGMLGDGGPSANDTDKAALERLAGIVLGTTKIETEAITNAAAGFSDPILLAREIQLASRRVCKILVDRGAVASGSGFLVGPQTVLTNWHVVRALGQGRKADPDEARKRVKVIFDRCFNDAPLLGVAPKPGHTIGVQDIEYWDPAYPDEYIEKEIRGDTQPWNGAEERLDFALIRLDGVPGVQRGWYKLLHDLWPTTGTPVYLLQYPGQAAMKVSPGRYGDAHQANRRVDHNANAARGSSGGLCLSFDAETSMLKPTAMHQASRTTTSANGQNHVVNQAIPLAKVAPLISKMAARIKGHVPISRLNAASGLEHAGAPVLGRIEFQNYVAEAVEGTARIIIVRPVGAVEEIKRNIGKTFSEILLRSLLPPHSHIIVKLSAGSIQSDAREFTQALLDAIEPAAPDRLPLPELKDAATTETAWIVDQLLRSSLFPRIVAAARGRLVWLVIDDLDRIDLPDAGGRRLLDALYQNISAIAPLRIVLIGLKRDLPSIDPASLRIDKLMGPPDDTAVCDWLQRRLGRDRNIEADVLQSLGRIASSFAGQSEWRALGLATALRKHFDPSLPEEMLDGDLAEDGP